MISTYGEFIVLVRNTKIFETISFFEEWDSSTEEEAAEMDSSIPLTKELVLAFAEDVAGYFCDRISNIQTEGLYSSMCESAHSFLKEIYVKAKKCNIEVELKEIDVPLTITESLIKSGVARVIPPED